ncbi:hypothetical protein EUGRSUZ_F00950 [Eucalyptus grandis]|uniref:Uncharacterized protein n=2 Tax=Eucalyptus grandis TaxID=71139 RepID=A0ACC3KCR1_EUCGR|nr:hypothetical protein EUGRSUZ_F00950 [Eucalyptus grandis]
MARISAIRSRKGRTREIEARDESRRLNSRRRAQRWATVSPATSGAKDTATKAWQRKKGLVCEGLWSFVKKQRKWKEIQLNFRDKF